MTTSTAKRIMRAAAGLLVAASLLAGCANHAQTGALTGAAVGGAMDGKRGAFVGGVTGYMIGNEMDKKQARNHPRGKSRRCH